MNKIKLLSYCCSVLSLCACTLEEFDPNTWAIEPVLELSESGLIFTNSDREGVVVITTNYQEVEISVSDEWCKWRIDGNNLHVIVEPNDAIEQRQATLSVRVSRGSKSLNRDLSIVQFGGYWDIVGEFSVFWTNELLSSSQKEVIENMLINMQKIEGGFFYMGSQNKDENAVNYYSDINQNNVQWIVVPDFYISKYEVKQKEWAAIMGYNNSIFSDLDKPVENITWEEAMIFTQQLSKLTNMKISLPTEAQWEYAAKGGKYDKGYIYPGSNDYTEVAYYRSPQLSEYSPLYTTSVMGLLKSNDLGLYDMAGNVAEYCANYNSQSINIRNDDIIVKGGCFMDDYTKFLIPSEYKSSKFIGVRLVVNYLDY